MLSSCQWMDLIRKPLRKIKFSIFCFCVFLLTFSFYLRNKENWPCWCECSHPEKKYIREEKKNILIIFFLSFLCRIILVKQGLLRIPSQTVSLLIRFRFHFHFLFLFFLVPKIPSMICKNSTCWRSGEKRPNKNWFSVFFNYFKFYLPMYNLMNNFT
jgi:hypothetical protein